MNISFSTKSNYVYEHLKNNIIENELKSGEPLIISNIAKQFEVSETPVREAIKRLEAEGLVKYVAHSSVKVAIPSLEKLQEIMDVRINLELLAIRKFYKNINSNHIDNMRNIVDAMVLAIEENDYKKYSVLDKKYHEYILDNCGNETLREIIYNLWIKSEYARSVFNHSKEYIKISMEEHKNIVESMSNNVKAEVICRLYEKHKKESFKRLIEHLRTQDK